MYRINYGNGQVSSTFERKQQARAELAALTQYREFAFIEFREGSEWFRCRAA